MHQQLYGEDNRSEIVVEGAVLDCTLGLRTGELSTLEQGYDDIDGKKIANRLDIGEECIPCFGKCSKLTALNAGQPKDCIPNLVQIPWIQVATRNWVREERALLKKALHFVQWVV